MIVAVNTRLLIPHKMEGIAWYANEILKRIVHRHPEHDFYFIFDRNFDDQFIYADNVKGIKLLPQARHSLLYKWWFHRSLPKLLKKINADVFFSPEGYIPLKTKVPCVNVIHDLGFEHFPDHVPKRDLAFYQTYFPQYARLAKKIITVSDFSKQDISKNYNIDSEKILTIHNGVREALKVEKAPADNPYFVYVGSMHPRKNISRMLKAFDQFISQKNSPHRFKLIGRKMGRSNAINRTYNALEHKDRIDFMGYLSEGKLAEIISSAQALIYVPLFEGFGLPILEAYLNDIPLICADNSSLPEVAGDGALMVDAENEKDIAEAMVRISESEGLRNELIEKGKKQLSRFSWDKAAEQTWNVISDSAKA